MAMITVHEVWTGDRLRFASIRHEEALAFAQRIYSGTRALADMVEYERAPVDFRQQPRRAT